VDIDDEIKAQGLIPPASLQMLIENAIKHNRFSVNEPLQITVKSKDSFLLISNNVRPKAVTELSNGIGLENIRKRYELASGQAIEIIATVQYYLVKIPIIAPS
jgi:two-component system, LytTR family, sensor kinase